LPKPINPIRMTSLRVNVPAASRAEPQTVRPRAPDFYRNDVAASFLKAPPLDSRKASPSAHLIASNPSQS
jgi:hypothetical protein